MDGTINRKCQKMPNLKFGFSGCTSLWSNKRVGAKLNRGVGANITLGYYSLYDRIRLSSLQTQISSYIYAPLGAKTTLSCPHFEDDSSPHISRSSSLIQIKDTHSVLFKHVSLIYINYLET
jgi:hypothetical protein